MIDTNRPVVVSQSTTLPSPAARGSFHAGLAARSRKNVVAHRRLKLRIILLKLTAWIGILVGPFATFAAGLSFGAATVLFMTQDPLRSKLPYLIAAGLSSVVLVGLVQLFKKEAVKWWTGHARVAASISSRP